MPPSLINNLRKVNRIIKDNQGNTIMDLSRYSFMAPPTLLPILQYMELHNVYKYKPHLATKSYLKKVLGKKKCTDTTIPLRKLKKFHYKDYFQVADKIELYLSDLTDEIVELIPSKVDAQSVNVLFYEMLTNIYKHSQCNTAYVLCQKYPRVNTIDICIIDDGISIPGSFENEGIGFENDSEAIYDAINGRTTDKEKYNLHGRGLNTSANITSLGFGEEMLVASRKGVCTVNKRGVRTWNKNMPFIDGTFVTLRINTNKIKNIHEYIKRREFNKNE
ncbi:hypothetical protein [Methanobrevibacter sp.]|uniref:hypothetical protein n=1 Tax=Methanobrevibacter sp. TaxID=66852 RepID=UPI00386B6F7D